jgi:hypothetical protein
MTAPAPCPHCNLPRVTREGAEPACYYCDILPAKRRAAAQRRARGHVVAGVDLDKALAAYRKLPPFKGNLGAIKLRVAHRTAGGTRGTAWPVRRRFRIAAGPDATPERVLEVLVHEMCHLAVPRDTHHGERFRLVFRRACRELWGIDLPRDPPASQGCIAYGMGEIATKALKEKIASGEIDLFPSAPTVSPTKPSRAELAAKVVEKRAAHAFKMMARAEKRSKAAQRALTKWREKVRYYERQAARRVAGP